jgi:hypothetical protein
LISVACNERGQARLRVTSPQGEAVLFLEGGGIVHAELDSLEGEDVLFKVLAWEEGGFELERDVAPPRQSIELPLSTLLMQSMKRVDEEEVASVDEAAILLPTEAFGSEDDVCQALAQMDGVTGVVLVSSDGIVLAHSLDCDDPAQLETLAEREGAVAVFVGHAAGEMGGVLGMDTFASAVVDRGRLLSRMMVIRRPDYYVGLLLGEKASPALLASRLGSFWD